MLVLTRRVGETVNVGKDVTQRVLILVALLTLGVGVAWADAGLVYLGAGVTHDN